MSKETIVLVWTFAVTVVLLIWVNFSPPYNGSDIPKEMRSLELLNKLPLDPKILSNISR